MFNYKINVSHVRIKKQLNKPNFLISKSGANFWPPPFFMYFGPLNLFLCSIFNLFQIVRLFQILFHVFIQKEKQIFV